MSKARITAVIFIIIALVIAIALVLVFKCVKSKQTASKSETTYTKLTKEEKNSICLGAYIGSFTSTEVISEYCKNSSDMPRQYIKDKKVIDEAVANKLKSEYGDEKFNAIMESGEIKEYIKNTRLQVYNEMDKLWKAKDLKTVSQRCNYYNIGEKERVERVKKDIKEFCGIELF